MAKVTAGGDPERYMDAPSVSSGDGESGGGSFFANLLDFIGVNKAVGKLTDKATGKQAADSANGAMAAAGPTSEAPAKPATEANGVSKLLNDFDSAFGNTSGGAAGQSSFLTPIDPDIAALLPRTSL